jgi:hypothetical protein
MALETGNYISDLVKTNPLSSDNISEGDDHLQLIKKILQRTFPMGTDTSLDSGVGPDQAVQVLIAEDSPGPTIDTSASGNAARAMGLLWLDTSNNLLKIRNQANDAWITLSIDPETSNKVDINDGTIDGVAIENSIIGAATPAAGTFVALEGTAVKATSSLTLDTGVDMIFEGATADAYETTVTVTDPTADRTITIPNATDTLVGKATTDTLTNKTMTSSGNTFDDSTSSVKGMASFSTDNFSVSSGAVTIKDEGVANAELANMAANTVKVRDANSTGDPSDVAVASTELLIGNGAGFNTATLSQDVTITNAGVATVGKIGNVTVDTSGAADNYVLKYDSSSAKFSPEPDSIANHLTTKGDILSYSTTEGKFAVGSTDDYPLVVNSSATFGINYAQLATDGMADNAVTLAKLEDGTQGDILYYGASGAPTRLAKGSADDVLTMNSGATAPEWASASAGDITGVSAGNGLTGGGTSGDVTLTVGAGTGITVNTSDIQVATTYAGGTSIATVGTVGTGTWQGTAVADGYISSASTWNGAVTTANAALPKAGGTMSGTITCADETITGAMLKDYSETKVAMAAHAVDLSLGNVQTYTLSGTQTLTFTNPIASGNSSSFTLLVTNGGSATLNWPTEVDWAGGTAPTLTSSGIDALVFTTIDGGTIWYGFAAGLDLK